MEDPIRSMRSSPGGRKSHGMDRQIGGHKDRGSLLRGIEVAKGRSREAEQLQLVLKDLLQV